MARKLLARAHAWKLKEPFAISRGVRSEAHVVIVELHENGTVGRGEACGVPYHGETPQTMLVQIEQVRSAIEAGCDRRELLEVLPAGGARHAVDAALWDLEAKRTGVPVWQRAAAPRWEPVESAVTVSIRDLDAYEAAARERAGFAWLKVKVGRGSPYAAIAAVRRGAPHARLIVDANQAWTIEELREYTQQLHPLRVDLLEQPLAAGADAGLAGYASPIPLCADESLSTQSDLPGLVGRYQFINIKLDKVGGLTAGLELACAARAAGFRLMVGCMLGGSVSVAPGMVLAQQCDVCDLDGPWLQAEDWPHGIVYRDGRMALPEPALWG
ncbi:MAG: N-acetyl-D-Glu racemase DgcA [Rhodanobacter sp.]|jgi:L-alanine-DL-glutamate epimerase-like enolase superfamily enzyme|uniref:N-acetyl-D-Glu racemase DgcA n=1 Tax=Rhodanobacter sp. KK11 TaxID=3083255 RepID=UPI00296770FD|nr:N-acetyl-D-Glu racemase DgcA [Rhodanobacter sp. KK11]MDW2980950.1 N-acetyl-D-Glu racemase DgcA [Rhodanobacter sp. KK11]